MSSSRIAPTSTTASSSNCSSRPRRPRGGSPDARAGANTREKRTAIVACGALGGHLRDIAARRGWDVRIACLPSMLHNSPHEIAPRAERLAAELQSEGFRVVLAYADCGTYGELDRLCERRGLARLPGLHCYDVLAGPERIRAALESEPGTYLLTDFLIRSFRYSVIASLGLDRHPDLWPDYFGHYRRVVWLAQSPSPELRAEADAVAAMFGLPLTVIEVGTDRLERELESLLLGDPGAGGGGAAGGPRHGLPVRVMAEDFRRAKDFRRIRGKILQDHRSTGGEADGSATGVTAAAGVTR